ncbi:MAG: peptidylprolyl isomerase [Elusimicrobia bacterium]|nr:peptidylprolyl isomerase [Elusimicrobiota bacterium]
MKKYIIIVFMGLLFLGGCSRKEDVIAHVNNRKITVEDFKRRLEGIPEYYMGFIATRGGKRQYLSSMIKEEVLLKKAYELNLDKKQEVVKQLENLKREIMLAAAMDELQKSEITISDQDLRSYYEKNKDKYINPREVKVSHILMSSQNKAEEVLGKIQRGTSFGSMAREESIDTVTAINGGDLGYIARGEMSELAFEEAIFELQRVGQVSDIVKTQFGYHIVKLTGKRRGNKKSFEEAKENIKRILRQQRFDSLIENYRKEYNVRVDYNVLDSIKLSNKDEYKEEENDKEVN